MEYGRIQRDERPITLSEWDDVMAAHDFLEQLPDRTMINPFTKEEIPVSGRGKAHYVERGKKVGNASLEDGEILTTEIPRDVCEQIAKRLGANVIEDDRS